MGRCGVLRRRRWLRDWPSVADAAGGGSVSCILRPVLRRASGAAPLARDAPNPAILRLAADYLDRWKGRTIDDSTTSGAACSA